MLKLRKAGHIDLEKYYSLLELDYDDGELLPRLALHKAVMNGTVEFDLITDDNTGLDVAYALVFVKGVYGYDLIKYVGVLPWYRGQGIGLETMRMLNRRFADKQGLIAELPEFDYEDSDRTRRLMRFFARFGYTETETDYNMSGKKVHLYVKPLKSDYDISPVSHRVINDFYTSVLSPAAMKKMIDVRQIEK